MLETNVGTGEELAQKVRRGTHLISVMAFVERDQLASNGQSRHVLPSAANVTEKLCREATTSTIFASKGDVTKSQRHVPKIDVS